MQNKNKSSITGFAISHLYWGALIAYWYRTLCFRVIPGFTLVESNVIFWSLYAGLITIGFLLTIRRRRNDSSMSATVFTPVALYFFWSYWQSCPNIVTTMLVILLIVACVYVSLVGINLVHDYRRGKRISFGRAASGMFYGTRTITGICAGILVIATVSGIGFGKISSNIEASNPVRHSCTISDNIETVSLLNEDSWNELSVEEKLDVLQVIANIEASYLGLPHELNVSARILAEDICGNYDDSTHTVTLNLDYLSGESAHDVLETVLHEAYHAYERRLVDLYNRLSTEDQKLLMFESAPYYQENFENYIDGHGDILGYMLQDVEIDSRRYATFGVEDYYTRIEEYLTCNSE